MKVKIENHKVIVCPPGTKDPEHKKGTNFADKIFYIDGLLKDNCDSIKKTIRKNWDYLFCIDGEVGAGKSIFAQLLGFYLSDGKLKIENIVFTGDDFKERVLAANRYDCIIFDEAFRGLSARSSLSKVNTSIVQMLNEIRQKNLFVLIVLPSVWDLDTFVRLQRTKGVFNVYTSKGKERGYFRFFRNDPNENFFKSFFHKSLNKYKYPPFPQMKGRFQNQYFVDPEEYSKIKLEVLGVDVEAENQLRRKNEFRKELLLGVFYRLKARFPDLNQRETAEIMGINKKTLRNWGFEGRINPKEMNYLKKTPQTPNPKEDFSIEV